MNNSKKLTFALVAVYLFPWGLQFLINNFMPIYVASLPFATEKTVGGIISVGAGTVMLSQLIWANIADHSKDKSKVLAASFILVLISSVLFLTVKMSIFMLYLLSFVLYLSFMAHQLLVDTITAENYQKTNKSFAYFRAFATLGYAVIGIIFAFVTPKEENGFFIYVIIICLISFVTSLLINTSNVNYKKDNKIKVKFINKSFILFLVYTCILFICGSMISTFFPVYYSSDKGLGGSVGTFSLLVTIGSFIEWGVLLLFSKIGEKVSFKMVFTILAIAGVIRSGIIYFVRDDILVSSTFLFYGIWFGILWSMATPYIKSIVPMESLTKAEGIWTVTASGFSTMIGSFLGGQIADALGLRSVFAVATIMMVVLSLLSPIIIKDS